MKKMLNTGFVYGIAAMAGGVFYREFTKLNGFTGRTALGFVHPHLFGLGALVFLLAALFASRFPEWTSKKKFFWFYRLYNAGLPITACLLLIRGVLQVRKLTLSAGLDASISGVAGIGHLLLGAGIVFLFLSLKDEAASC